MEIKPCPFCKSLKIDFNWWINVINCYCKNCNAEGPYVKSMFWNLKRTIAAIEVWNSRS